MSSNFPRLIFHYSDIRPTAMDFLGCHGKMMIKEVVSTEQTWFTAEEAWTHLRISKSTFYRLVKAKKIVPYHIEGVEGMRFKRDELDALPKRST